MPYSTGYFKQETKNYILNSYDKNIRILDVGAGCGTYSDLLKPLGYENIDCVEVFEDYIHKFNLNNKYNNVYLGDITKLDIDFSKYDLIILGDVLEHIDLPDAKILLNKIGDVNTIIGVPFNSPQGEHFGNLNEIHLQEDLTFMNFFERYDNQKPLCLRFDYGIFVKKEYNQIFLEVGEKDLPNEYMEYIKNNYSNYTLHKLNEPQNNINNKVTIVTGIWDLGRGNISDSFKRTYDDYLERLKLLLGSDVNMYIFADKSDEEFIWKYRKRENTVINIMSLDDLKTWFNFTEKVNNIRKNPEWLKLSGWLPESPQATLEGYNPVVMSKMFMLNNVTIWNPFKSDYFFWIDAGITSTVHYGYFTHDKVFNNLPEFIDNNNEFVFLTYPYEGGDEIHGFKREDIARYSNTDYVRFVCRGGFFGGTKNRINQINGIYYGYLNNTLNEGLMGTEESIFSIILYNHPDLVTQYNIEGNGLIWPFFEDLKNKEYKKNVFSTTSLNNNSSNNGSVGLYVITYNSPSQFEKLCLSFEQYDPNFLNKTKKYLLNNSLDKSTFDEYDRLCKLYNFEEIHKDNLGICGGRQFIAEHFDSTGLDYYLFFEDDMFFYPKKGEVCRNGFNRYFDDFFNKTVEIISNEKFDFLKLNYSEFYGDNGTQWSWYNVPQSVREEYWPNNKKLPQIGLDPNAPKTTFEKIVSHKGIPYASGEIYYCNWPQIVSKSGNKKMFLDTKWSFPYEQTWMSHIYQETKKGKIKSGLILGTPTEHDRFDFYPKEERREN
jgi:SAM-dependent methyltransferase